MEADRRRRQFYSIDGTAARKPEYAEETWQETGTAVPRREQNRQPERRLERERRQEQRLAPQTAAPAVDLLAMLVLVAALGATFLVCVNYLKVQADISATRKATARLESMTEELVTKNDYTELKIQESIDLAEIQKTAMEELGMVYPYNNQMITYEVNKTGYVRQYGELTGNEQENVIELLMRMLFSSGSGSRTAAGE